MRKLYVIIFLVASIGSLIGCGSLDGYISSECKNAIYADIRLSKADETRRFYVNTKLENWTQGQLAGAIDEGGYLENIEPCRTEVRVEFDRRGYKW